MILASFVFENNDDIKSGKFILHQESKDDVHVKIDRKLRREPLLGMKQPTPPGAMLGWEASLSVMYKGQIADGYPFELHEKFGEAQKGLTDANGVASLDIEFPEIRRSEFTLHINEKEVIATDGCDKESNQTDNL